MLPTQTPPHLQPVTCRPRRQWPRLAALTAAVLLGHGLLLSSTPLALPSHAESGAPVERPFTTRTIVLASPVQAVTPPHLPSRRVPPSPTRQPAVAPASPTAQVKTEPLVLASTPATEALPEAAPPVPESPPADTPVEVASLATQNPPEAAVTAATAEADTPSAEPPAAYQYTIPGSVRIKYDIKGEIKGIPYFVNGELLWLHDGKTYDARTEISHFLLGSRVQTSKGELTLQGLEPIRFGDKVRSEVAAHFERSKNKVSFSANTPDVPLLPGTQDQLSVFVQLASMLGSDPNLFTAGSSVTFQTVGPRSAEVWVFKVGTWEQLALPGGTLRALKFTKDPLGENDARAEVWLAPDLNNLPARIRLTQGNGDFVDQQWRTTQKP
ncbi:MAG: hypothetical protein A3F78_00790 [Burkholderiales bacterium RIFCSPLOWO2_12_FULL_61_40]|nr:MAG: hypothetical protein A3F78_00790 [Burkholderiales bacterium RIFCSPLOWO2_12_FULL_61_40]